MFPIRDDNPTLHKSVVTFLIILINVAVWIFVQGAGFNPTLAKSLCVYGLVPGELLGLVRPGTAVPLGGGLACVVENTHHWYTMITHMFMHGGWFHIIGNMWFLAIFGDNVEDSMGSIRFVFFYLLCGLAAAATQMGLDPHSAVPMVGASGAIGGVMGAYVILYPRAPIHMLVFLGFFITRIIVPAYFMLGYWFLLQVVGLLPALGGSSGGVAVGAHVGGFLAGVILIFFFRRMDRVREKRALRWRGWRYR
ncbi:MAG TPA: rhomboid family intramembrane serine protease [Chitinivibrionales bacterium]|nr:rhomboid family intramembrane serine protease [Chitinivibrionales bacterium]